MFRRFRLAKKAWGGVGGPADPLTVFVSDGFAVGAGLFALGEKFPYKFAGREHSDQANLRRPQTASLLKKVAAATFLTSSSGGTSDCFAAFYAPWRGKPANFVRETALMQAKSMRFYDIFPAQNLCDLVVVQYNKCIKMGGGGSG